MDRPLEYCCLCSDPTGRAGRGEDSIYLECCEAFQLTVNPEGPYIMPGGEVGPLCIECSDRLKSLGYIHEV